MTDTSPVAKLVAGLPKGNGLARAVPRLFEQRGALIPAIMLLRVREAGLDDDDVEHMRFTIERAELCLGELERDGKELLGRASEAATSREGQQALFADDADFEAQRAELLGYLEDWQNEQDPPVTSEALEAKWQSFHGGNYDHRLDHGAPAHLREFAISIGALADSTPDGEVIAEPVDVPDAEVTEGDRPVVEDDPDAEPAVPQPAFSGGEQ
jgi:hypothetical protein